MNEEQLNRTPPPLQGIFAEGQFRPLESIAAIIRADLESLAAAYERQIYESGRQAGYLLQPFQTSLVFTVTFSCIDYQFLYTLAWDGVRCFVPNLETLVAQMAMVVRVREEAMYLNVDVPPCPQHGGITKVLKKGFN